jgi:predicted Zn-dependent protease with MMP-like domain
MDLPDSVKSKTLIREVAHYAGYDEEKADSLENKCFEWNGS